MSLTRVSNMYEYSDFDEVTAVLYALLSVQATIECFLEHALGMGLASFNRVATFPPESLCL